MMRLSSDYALRLEETGVRFNPQTLMEGEEAWDVGRRYFPKLTSRLEEDRDSLEDALVVIGGMEAVLPDDFVNKGSAPTDMNDDDGLWSD